eukprot:SAG11_NODE_138_length_15111_cov_11.388289_12_plen_85_part_00
MQSKSISAAYKEKLLREKQLKTSERGSRYLHTPIDADEGEERKCRLDYCLLAARWKENTIFAKESLLHNHFVNHHAPLGPSLGT